MSLIATRWAWDMAAQHELTPNQTLVLLSLAEHHNADSGRCNPGKDRIADRTRLHRNTVRRALRYLKGRRLVKSSGGCKGRGNSPHYTLLGLAKYAKRVRGGALSETDEKKGARWSKKGCTVVPEPGRNQVLSDAPPLEGETPAKKAEVVSLYAQEVRARREKNQARCERYEIERQQSDRAKAETLAKLDALQKRQQEATEN